MKLAGKGFLRYLGNYRKRTARKVNIRLTFARMLLFSSYRTTLSAHFKYECFVIILIKKSTNLGEQESWETGVTPFIKCSTESDFIATTLSWSIFRRFVADAGARWKLQTHPRSFRLLAVCWQSESVSRTDRELQPCHCYSLRYAANKLLIL